MIDPDEPAVAEGVFDGLKVRAIALGVVVDHVSTMVFAILLTLVAGSEDITSENEELAKAALETLASSPSFLISGLIGGLLCSVLAAFVGARYAGTRHVQHGAWIVVASSLMVFVVYAGSGSGPGWVEALGWLLVLPSGLLGGFLARWADEQATIAESDEY